MQIYLYICFFFRTFVAQMRDIIQYIIRFLLYGHSEAAEQVGYTSIESDWEKYRVVIVPNGHLGKEIVLPDMEEAKVERIQHEDKTTWIIRTDIVYNTFFYISRAEELINQQRDEHGRFLAKHSLLGQHNRLMIPTVDEYARMLMKMMDLPLLAPAFSHIYLTHDVDSIALYRHLRGALGGIYRGQWRQVWASLRDIHNDPAFTFSWLISLDKQVDRAQSIYFIKQTHGQGYDYPQYDVDGEDFGKVKQLIENSDAQMGWHSSYYGDSAPKRSANEMEKVHRSHFLRCSIERMQELADMGVTDDYTMMFADHIGFRLQTTRPVRWINPKTMQLTELTLHPLTVMDCTLSNSQYMNLNEDEAYFACQRLFEKVYQNAGELVLLWHNTIVAEEGYHRWLYPKLLNLLNE